MLENPVVKMEIYSTIRRSIFVFFDPVAAALTIVTRHIRAALYMVEILRLHFLLVCFPVVEVVEVGYNDRNRQGYSQHTGNGTQGPYYLSPHTYGPAVVS